MSFRVPVARALGTALFTASLLLTAMPEPSFALDPPRPLPGYHPAFVTEREPGPWEDCAWAAAAMLMDKWTNGVTVVSRERLRTLSGDLTGGSNLGDVRRSFAQVGLELRWSPSGGDTITWPVLLDRLRNGSGAILLGDYANLPRRYGRWDPTLWQNTDTLDDHALYLDGYDPKTRRILVMDPVAPAGWDGEWVPVSALKAFAWHSGSKLWSATTPTAADPPFAGVELGAPLATGDAAALHVRWPIEAAPAAWIAPGFSASAQTEALAEADPLATDVAAFPADDAAPPAPTVRTGTVGTSLEATIPLPSTPGIYRVTATLTDNRFGRQVATAGPFNLYVPGPRAWSFSLPGEKEVASSGLARLSFVVANVGTESWTEPPPVPGPFAARPQPRNTRLVGTWVGPATAGGDRALTGTPADIDFGPLPLEPGYAQPVDALIEVPMDPGSWRLVVRVVDDLDGPTAFTGSAPGVMIFDIQVPGEAATPQ